MKKGLLLLAAITVSFCAQAQDILLTEDCSTSMSVGNVGTSLDGTTPGQNGWLTRLADAASGSNASFQVVDMGGAYGNGIQLTGANVANGTPSKSRLMFKDASALWAGRDPLNNIAEVEFDFYTGPVTTSTNVARFYLLNAASDPTNVAISKILGGLSITMNTLAIQGVSYYDNAGTAGNYGFYLGQDTSTTPPTAVDIFLQPDTWYKFGVSFDLSTGQVIWRESNGLFNGGVVGDSVANAGSGTAQDSDADPTFLSFFMSAGVSNAVASNAVFDNLKFKASPTDMLLGTKQNTLAESKFSVSPNPATDVIRVTNTENIAVTGIAVSDLNGRVVKQLSYNDASNIQVNVSDLAAGMYLMKITSDKGVATKKIIKN